MNAKETLRNAIFKAVDNGWKWKGFEPYGVSIGDNLRVLMTIAESWEDTDDEGEIRNETENTYAFSRNDLIYDHSFAKALWMPGQAEQIIAYQFHERLARNNEDLMESGIIPIWKYHLMQMAVAPDPISYLAENMP